MQLPDNFDNTEKLLVLSFRAKLNLKQGLSEIIWANGKDFYLKYNGVAILKNVRNGCYVRLQNKTKMEAKRINLMLKELGFKTQVSVFRTSKGAECRYIGGGDFQKFSVDEKGEIQWLNVHY